MTGPGREVYDTGRHGRDMQPMTPDVPVTTRTRPAPAERPGRAAWHKRRRELIERGLTGKAKTEAIIEAIQDEAPRSSEVFKAAKLLSDLGGWAVEPAKNPADVKQLSDSQLAELILEMREVKTLDAPEPS